MSNASVISHAQADYNHGDAFPLPGETQVGDMIIFLESDPLLDYYGRAQIRQDASQDGDFGYAIAQYTGADAPIFPTYYLVGWQVQSLDALFTIDAPSGSVRMLTALVRDCVHCYGLYDNSSVRPAPPTIGIIHPDARSLVIYNMMVFGPEGTSPTVGGVPGTLLEQKTQTSSFPAGGDTQTVMSTAVENGTTSGSPTHPGGSTLSMNAIVLAGPYDYNAPIPPAAATPISFPSGPPISGGSLRVIRRP